MPCLVGVGNELPIDRLWHVGIPIAGALGDLPAEKPTCLTLHWEWERRRGYSELKDFCAALEGRVSPWTELIGGLSNSAYGLN